MIRDDRIVWLDMEMTGLDPETCVPIEVAVIVTDSELVELGSYEAVLAASDEALATMDEFVRDMHTRNGLLARVKTATTSLAEADAAMVALVNAWCTPRTGVLAGNSIWQDRRFIRRYLPALDAALHYRMIDVSTIKELAWRWYGETALLAKESAHTAMADIRASIAELIHYRDTLLRPRPEEKPE